MKALITGITGQDGAYLTQLLLSKGYKVVGASRHSASINYWRLSELGLLDNANLELISLDVTCSSSVNNVLSGYNFDEVYNLAAQSFVAESFVSPLSTFQINAMGVLNLLEAIRRINKNIRFYQASTSEMFGLTNVEGQTEATPFHPRSPYAVAKAAAHYTVQNYREAYGLHASCGILFNHESPLRGLEFVTRKVTDGAVRCLVGETNKLLLGNMDAKRDWGHARDYVKGMWKMLQRDTPDDYVLATGEAHSVYELVQFAFDSVGLDWHEFVKPDKRFMRPSEVPYLCGSANKAKLLLGWEPETTFRELIAEMVASDLRKHGGKVNVTSSTEDK